MSKETDNQNESVIPNVSEASNTLGDIRINHSVVASIVRLAALEVSGVAAVGGGLSTASPRFSQKKVTSGASASKKTRSVTIVSRSASSCASVVNSPPSLQRYKNASPSKSRR